MKHTKAVSSSIDEYLEEMYRCELSDHPISTKHLAEELYISMPSVSEMLVKLKKGNLIAYQTRGTIKLTKKGRKIGADIYHKHETIKKFFIMLGLGEKKAAEQACRLEHELSNAALKKLQLFLRKQV